MNVQPQAPSFKIFQKIYVYPRFVYGTDCGATTVVTSIFFKKNILINLDNGYKRLYNTLTSRRARLISVKKLNEKEEKNEVLHCQRIRRKNRRACPDGPQLGPQEHIETRLYIPHRLQNVQRTASGGLL